MEDFMGMLMVISVAAGCCWIWFYVKVGSKITAEIEKQSACENFVKVYRLAPETSFSTLCNMVSSRMLNATTYTANSTLLAEFDAMKKVKEERKRGDSGMNELEGKSPEEMQIIITERIRNFSRPDIVLTKMTIYAKSYCLCSKQVAEDICFPISKEVYSFNLKFAELMGYEDALCRKMWKSASEAYQNRNANGLGFGIITTSAASMMAYGVLDSCERNKQLKNQETSIYARHSVQAKAVGGAFCEGVLEYYRTTYMPNAIAAIKAIGETMACYREKLEKIEGAKQKDVEAYWREHQEEKELLEREKLSLENEKKELENANAESNLKIEELKIEYEKQLLTEEERDSLINERVALISKKNKLGFFRRGKREK